MKTSQDPFFPNYPGIGLSIAGSGHEVFKLIEIINSADLLFISPLFQFLPEQDLVEGLMLCVDVVRGIEDFLMAITVEIVGGNDVKDALGCLAINQQRAQDAFFRVSIMRQFSLAHITTCKPQVCLPLIVQGEACYDSKYPIKKSRRLFSLRQSQSHLHLRSHQRPPPLQSLQLPHPLRPQQLHPQQLRSHRHRLLRPR